MPDPLPSEFYGTYAAEHHNRDYFADVGEKAVFVHKKVLGRTSDEWFTWVMIGDGDKNTNGDWELPIQSFGSNPGGGMLADGQKSIEFKPTGFFGGLFGKMSFTIEIKEEVRSQKGASITTYNLTFELIKSEENNPAYAAPPSTDKKGSPIPYALDTFAPGVAKKLVFDAITDTTAASGTTTDTSLLLGVGLMVVAVGFYGMSGKR